MTTIQDQIVNDWKEAMKARDAKKDVLSLMRTELKNKAINSREAGDSTTVVDDLIALDVLMKMAKQRREAIEQFQAGARNDLAQREAFELAVIESYLPKQLEDSEIEEIVRKIIAETGAQGPKDMGKVMSASMAACKGRAGGQSVQSKVKMLLGA
jgi:uncharacterized protein YqeY